MMMSSSLLLDIFELIHRADVGTIQLVKNFPDHFVFARVYEGGWRVIKSNARYINVSELAWNGIEFPCIVYVWVEENWPVGPFLFTCNNRHWKVKKKKYTWRKPQSRLQLHALRPSFLSSFASATKRQEQLHAFIDKALLCTATHQMTILNF